MAIRRARPVRVRSRCPSRQVRATVLRSRASRRRVVRTRHRVRPARSLWRVWRQASRTPAPSARRTAAARVHRHDRQPSRRNRTWLHREQSAVLRPRGRSTVAFAVIRFGMVRRKQMERCRLLRDALTPPLGGTINAEQTTRTEQLRALPSSAHPGVAPCRYTGRCVASRAGYGPRDARAFHGRSATLWRTPCGGG
jgi:hypothetical protein